MRKQLFEGKDPKEIRQLLEDNCDAKEDGAYTRSLDEDEVALYKDHLSQAMVELNRYKEELDVIKESYKEKMKPLQLEVQDCLQSIKTRTIEQSGVLYLIADHDEGMMGYYDEKGELVNSRRLRPEEKQDTLQGQIRNSQRSARLN